jgi:hypothetical protein
MFGMMTPIDAISYGLKAGMVFGQAQTIWATRLIEMQGFWMGFPGTVSDLPKRAPSETAATPSPVVTELHVEALAATPTAAAIPAPKPVAATATAQPRPVAKAKPRSKAPTPKPVLTKTFAEAPTLIPTPAEEPVTEVAPAPASLTEISTDIPAAVGAPMTEPTEPVVESIAPPPVAHLIETSTPPADLALKPIPRRAPPKAAPKPPFAE